MVGIIRIRDRSMPILTILLIVLSAFYCYLATLPKHVDFLGLNYFAKIVAVDDFDVYRFVATELSQPDLVHAMHPPGFYILQSIWLRLGSYLYNCDLSTWGTLDPNTVPCFYPFWNMIPYLLALFMLVGISHHALRNKWLCLICYGPFAFISVIVMGQTDVFCVLLIFISMVFFLRSFVSDRHLLLLFLATISLGCSMAFKTYGGLLFPVYIVFYILILKNAMENIVKIYTCIIGLIFTFIFAAFLAWIPYARWFVDVMFLGESGLLLNLQIAPLYLPPLHNISIWLLGYIIILYDLLYNLVNKPTECYIDNKYFIFYSFSSIAWFFAAVYTNPQWWMLLIPPILLVLDNFHSRFSYFFTFTILGLFYFYPMMWVNNIDYVLREYVPIVPIEGRFATVLSTLITSILILWIIDLKRELNDFSVSPRKDLPLISKMELSLPVIIIFILIISAMILFGVSSQIGVAQDNANQPAGEIFGDIIIGQTFIAPFSDLNRIDLNLATYDRLNTKDTIFHLRASPSSPDIVTIKLNAAEIANNQYHRFSFPKIQDSKGKSYYFFIESPDSLPGNAITVWYNGDDIYKEGSAYKNHTPVDGDLTFRAYFGSNGLLDRVLS